MGISYFFNQERFYLYHLYRKAERVMCCGSDVYIRSQRLELDL